MGNHNFTHVSKKRDFNRLQSRLNLSRELICLVDTDCKFRFFNHKLIQFLRSGSNKTKKPNRLNDLKPGIQTHLENLDNEETVKRQIKNWSMTRSKMLCLYWQILDSRNEIQWLYLSITVISVSKEIMVQVVCQLTEKPRGLIKTQRNLTVYKMDHCSGTLSHNSMRKNDFREEIVKKNVKERLLEKSIVNKQTTKNEKRIENEIPTQKTRKRKIKKQAIKLKKGIEIDNNSQYEKEAKFEYEFENKYEDVFEIGLSNFSSGMSSKYSFQNQNNNFTNKQKETTTLSQTSSQTSWGSNTSTNFSQSLNDQNKSSSQDISVPQTEDMEQFLEIEENWDSEVTNLKSLLRNSHCTEIERKGIPMVNHLQNLFYGSKKKNTKFIQQLLEKNRNLKTQHSRKYESLEEHLQKRLTDYENIRSQYKLLLEENNYLKSLLVANSKKITQKILKKEKKKKIKF
ncbi:hypothetical protein M0813_01912 [Anaeramoeba flamelloides]|uniref:Uncharacterized protein n=1 Tax=Anaeramoeba flamelloides TaxID=1746091 RepID=A0ABQ8YPY0_9EUKA|nr:hypothetical protein M0813_01912 [Anaeramoeba flamelloides]